ncbi:MaoC family dehydratase, partial [Candidatus Micrarchaeota archaeon]|nr:MaoC family dehydratase [Candidatus Micrarchaeota archaeon]
MIPERIVFKKTITAKDVDSFAEVSGDYNDLHVSDAFAAQTRFKERVVHGMLLASYFSQLVGMHLQTNKVLYLNQSLNFKNPVFIDDEIEV